MKIGFKARFGYIFRMIVLSLVGIVSIWLFNKFNLGFAYISGFCMILVSINLSIQISRVTSSRDVKRFMGKKEVPDNDLDLLPFKFIALILFLLGFAQYALIIKVNKYFNLVIVIISLSWELINNQNHLKSIKQSIESKEVLAKLEAEEIKEVGMEEFLRRKAERDQFHEEIFKEFQSVWKSYKIRKWFSWIFRNKE